MDVSQAVAGYISKMVSQGDNTAGTTNAKMKILLLDSETVSLSEVDQLRTLTLTPQKGFDHVHSNHTIRPS